MNINISNCIKANIIDCCSIWNILSSKMFYFAVVDNKFFFSTTKYVEYECLHKPRKSPKPHELEIQKRLLSEIQKGKFSSHGLTIEDLQDPEILKHRRSLGIGELSAIAFAKKTNQVFLTDDQGARKLGILILGQQKVQTTPQVLGWLFFRGILSDSDLQPIIDEHNQFHRPLERFFKEVYQEALRIRCLFGSPEV